MKVRVEQIRAGRALLGWSQKDLAQRADISEVSVVNFEKEKSTPHQGTVLKMLSAFELAGINFTPKGVEFKEDNITIIEGEGCYLRLLDDVYHTLIDKKDAELLIYCADDRVSSPEVNNRYRKMRNAGIRMRQLVEEGNTYLMGSLTEYRYIPKELFVNDVCLVYDGKFAIRTSAGASSAVVFKDDRLAVSWRNIFNLLWGVLKQPERSEASERF